MNMDFTSSSFDSIRNMKGFLDFCTEEHKDRTAFQYYTGKEVVNVSYIKFREDVRALAGYLLSQDFRGVKIALYGENSYSWIVSHFAITTSGNIAVPIDRNLQPEDVMKLVAMSGAKLFIYSRIFAAKAAEFQTEGLQLLCMNDLPERMKEGAEHPGKPSAENEPDDVAAVVYTSGTTGISKGVMLTHRNLIMNARASADAARIKGGNVMVLPLHHMLAFTTGVTAVMLYGYPVYINDSLRHVSRDLQLAKPQHIVLVPLIVEGLYKTIWRTAEKNGQAKKLKFGLTLSNAVSKIGIDIRRKLFKDVLAAVGGNLETVVCGGAALDEKYIRGFRDLGIYIINGYGITECSPVVSVNRLGKIKAGTVGQPLFCNEIRISNPDADGIGEICVRGSNVMAGYLDRPDATKETFDGEWLKTGDLGKLDQEGFLTITGRIKNLIILKNGENISPEELEEKLYRIEGVKECLVTGKDEQISAEIYPDPEVEGAHEKIDAEIRKMNKGLPSYKQIANIEFRDTEFEKTTTQKIKRKY
jgi:long-chain acyl-CoA synthetase